MRAVGVSPRRDRHDESGNGQQQQSTGSRPRNTISCPARQHRLGKYVTLNESQISDQNQLKDNCAVFDFREVASAKSSLPGGSRLPCPNRVQSNGKTGRRFFDVRSSLDDADSAASTIPSATAMLVIVAPETPSTSASCRSRSASSSKPRSLKSRKKVIVLSDVSNVLRIVVALTQTNANDASIGTESNQGIRGALVTNDLVGTGRCSEDGTDLLALLVINTP